MSRAQIIDQVKTWLTPGVVGVLGMFIWRDLSELRADVKQLLSQSIENHTKVARMEADIEMLNKIVFLKGSATAFQEKPSDTNTVTTFMDNRPLGKLYWTNDRQQIFGRLKKME